MFNEILILVAGIATILFLAEIIIGRSIEIAGHYGWSGTFIGLTVLSIGTSIPEIMTHIVGSLQILKHPGSLNELSGLLIGTNIGSDIFQQNFILALVGLIGTIVIYKKNLIKEMGALIAAAVIILIFSVGGFISRLEGIILVALYLLYLVYLKRSNVGIKNNGKYHLSDYLIASYSLVILVSFGVMAYVADFVLEISTELIKVLPLSASLFGIVLLGIATALPELLTSLVAIVKHQKDISAGILIGSNITNPLLGIGLGAMISTYSVPSVIIIYDLPFKILTAVLIFWFLLRRRDLGKVKAITLIALFLGYLVVRNLLFPADVFV